MGSEALEGPATRLRIYVSESERHDGRPLVQVLLAEALAAKLPGATVVRGVEGYGQDRQLHTARLVEVSSALPLIIEIVGPTEQISALLTRIEPLIQEGLATTEAVTVVLHRHRGRHPQ